MTNEWAEFKAYAEKPVFKLENKKLVSFLGRFTTEMISRNIGFNRIFVILARGILFHNPDGTLRNGDAYSRVEEARRFLCAWCSIPEKRNSRKEFDGKFGTDFRSFHNEFPEIVDENGNGWYYRYMTGLKDFINENRMTVSLYVHFIADRFDEWQDMWRSKVIHYQTALCAETTEADFPLLFDTAIADALELGPLRTEAILLAEDEIAKINKLRPCGVPDEVMPEIARFYIANKRPESEWVVLSVANMCAYFHSTEFSKKWLPKLPPEFIERKKSCFGVCMIRVNV